MKKIERKGWKRDDEKAKEDRRKQVKEWEPTKWTMEEKKWEKIAWKWEYQQAIWRRWI